MGKLTLPAPVVGRLETNLPEYTQIRKCYIQENGYEVQTRWYRTPTLFHKFNPDIPDTWWRCQLEKGTLQYILWSFPHHPNLLDGSTPNSWEGYIHARFLPGTISPTPYHLATISDHGKYRKTMHTDPLGYPTLIKQWLNRIDKIAEMEHLINIAHDAPTKFSSKWVCWTHF